MNLRFIEAFVWVARLHSFTAAAEKLYTTQAAISARIATLEEDFGVKLFERSPLTILVRAGLLTRLERACSPVHPSEAPQVQQGAGLAAPRELLAEP